MKQTQNMDPLLSRQEAAVYLNLSIKTLATWASTGRQELKMHKLGTKVMYRKSVLDAFIAEHEI